MVSREAKHLANHQGALAAQPCRFLGRVLRFGRGCSKEPACPGYLVSRASPPISCFDPPRQLAIRVRYCSYSMALAFLTAMIPSSSFDIFSVISRIVQMFLNNLTADIALDSFGDSALLPPRIFSKSLPIRKMVRRGGGDRTRHRW